MTIESSASELTNAGESEAIAALALSSAAPVSLGQPVLGRGVLGEIESDGNEPRPATRVVDRLHGADHGKVGRRWWSEDALVYAGLALTAAEPIATARATCLTLLHSLVVFTHAPDSADQEAAMRRPIHWVPDGGWPFSGGNAGQSMKASASMVLASVVAGYVYFRPAAQWARSKNQLSFRRMGDVRRPPGLVGNVHHSTTTIPARFRARSEGW